METDHEMFYDHSAVSADSRRAIVVTAKSMSVLLLAANHLDLTLPRNSVSKLN